MLSRDPSGRGRATGDYSGLPANVAHLRPRGLSGLFCYYERATVRNPTPNWGACQIGI